MTKPATRTAPDLRPVEEAAKVLKMDPGELTKLWKKQRGAPTLTKVKAGLYRIDWAEFLDYLEDRQEPTAELRAQRRKVIRRGAFGHATRQHPLRSHQRRRDNAG